MWLKSLVSHLGHMHVRILMSLDDLKVVGSAAMLAGVTRMTVSLTGKLHSQLILNVSDYF